MRFLVVILLLLIPGHRASASDPAETWMLGYLYLQEALATEKKGDTTGSITLLVRSLDCYRILAREDEGFEPARRNERILLIADKLKLLGGDPLMSYLPSPAGADRAAFSGNAAGQMFREMMTSPERLLAMLAPDMPENWLKRRNAAGSHVIVPLIQTNETRRYHALVSRLERELGPKYRMIPLFADGGKTE